MENSTKTNTGRIVEIITDSDRLWSDLQGMDSYKTAFSLKGARVLMESLFDLAEETGVDVVYCPVTIAIEYSEYTMADIFKYFDIDPEGIDTETPDSFDVDALRDALEEEGAYLEAYDIEADVYIIQN